MFVLCGGGREISAAAKSELQQTIDSLVCLDHIPEAKEGKGVASLANPVPET